jgi:hypothetical protein
MIKIVRRARKKIMPAPIIAGNEFGAGMRFNLLIGFCLISHKSSFVT